MSELTEWLSARRDDLRLWAPEKCTGQGADVYRSAATLIDDVLEPLDYIKRYAGHMDPGEINAWREAAEMIAKHVAVVTETKAPD